MGSKSLLAGSFLTILLLSFMIHPVIRSRGAEIPGDSYNPILLPLDPEHLHLFFSHEIVQGDVWYDVLLQMTLTQGTWSEATPLTGYRQFCYRPYCDITGFHHSNETTIYIVDGEPRLLLKTYQNGMWNEWRPLLNDTYFQYPVNELRIITDAKNQLHMVWEQFHWTELENGSYYGKHVLLYSTYNGTHSI